MHHFTDFKSFSEAQIDLFQPLTMLIGPNGAGKSNLIEGVELLSFIANGGLLYEITEINQGGKEEIRGGLQACTRHGQNSFTLGFSGRLKFEGKPKLFDYHVMIPKLDSPFIVFEQLLLENKPLFKTKTVSKTEITPHSHQVQYNNFERGGNKPDVSVSSMQSVLSQYPAFATNNKKRQACLTVVAAITNYLRASFVFDPNPKLMREYVRIGNSILTKNGANLAAVLYALSQGTEAEKQSLQRLLKWIRQLPGEPYQDFEFVVVKELNDVIFGFKEQDAGTLTSAKVLSDGTLRCLAVLTALETVEPRSRIIIEEFDNGLHPSRVKVLVKAVEDCCQRRKLNILVTTHNPATLNALSPAQLDGVVLCSWDKSSHSSKLLRLRELHYQDELLERGQLGDLVTRQVVDHYLSPNFEQDRKDKALTWLADF